jgi:hypothetical protein
MLHEEKLKIRKNNAEAIRYLDNVKKHSNA